MIPEYKKQKSVRDGNRGVHLETEEEVQKLLAVISGRCSNNQSLGLDETTESLLAILKNHEKTDPNTMALVAGAIQTSIVRTSLSAFPHHGRIRNRFLKAFSLGAIVDVLRFLENSNHLLNFDSRSDQSSMDRLLAVDACWSVVDVIVCEDYLFGNSLSESESDSDNKNTTTALQKNQKISIIDVCLLSLSRSFSFSSMSSSCNPGEENHEMTTANNPYAAAAINKILVHILDVLYTLLQNDCFSKEDFEQKPIVLHCLGVVSSPKGANQSNGADDHALVVTEKALEILVVCAKKHNPLSNDNRKRLLMACIMALAKFDSKSDIHNTSNPQKEGNTIITSNAHRNTRILDHIIELIECDDAISGLWLRHTYGIFNTERHETTSGNNCAYHIS
ncbi:unnamed protein product [Pseudo-nitzschia multistriata]|uniref:Uncharacterized protein n=1 Tax=Pseudo-nitzschia multistriata TaxID=183589 RepID=A0A448ZE93_9STRA|nr:unnamed protein product [Pseudo-nitzschia multistriata]